MAIKSISPWRSLKVRVTLFSLLILLTCIWSLAYFSSRMLHEDLQRLAGEQQFSTASIVAAEINDEIDFRFRALEQIASGISSAHMGNASNLQSFLEDRRLILELFNGGFFAIAGDGVTLADVPRSTGRIGMNVSEKGWMKDALQGKTTIGKPVIGTKLQVPVFTMAAPIHNTEGKVIGVLAGVIDLSHPSFLDKITENRYGKTGDYLMIAPQYRIVVTSSDKKRIMQPLPAAGVNPYIDRNIEGFEGSTVLVNPLGVEQFASIKKIPAAGWYLAIALPTDEAFAPIHNMQRRIVTASIILTVIAGVLTWFLMRRQLVPMLETVKILSSQPDSQLPFEPIPIAIHDEVGQLIGAFNLAMEQVTQSRELLANLAGMVPGVIYQYRLYADGRSAFPYSSPGMNDIYEVTPEEVREDAAPVFGRLHPDDYGKVSSLIEESARTLQTFYCEFRVNLPRQGLRWRWSQAHPERMPDGGTLWHGIISDVTERKLAEEALLSLKDRLQDQNEELQAAEEELRSQNDELQSAYEMLRVQIDEYETSQKLLKEREESLSRQNTLFASLLEMLPIGVFMVEAPSGKPLIANKAAHHLLGRGIHDDVSKENLSEVYKAFKAGTPDPYPSENMPIILGMRGLSSHIDDMEVERPDGTKALLEIFGAPVADDKGNIWASLASFIDITERKQAEQTLAESKALLHGIIDSTVDFIWSVAPDSFGLRSYNNSLREHFLNKRGISIATGMRPEELFPPGEAVQIWHDYYKRALAEGPFAVEYITYAGTQTLELSFNLLKTDENVFGISVFGKDITKRKQDYEQMKNISQRLQLATSSASLGVWDWNVRDNLMLWDDRMFELYGITKEAFPNSIDAWLNGLHPEDKAAAIAASQAALDGEQQFDTQFRVLHPDGTVKYLSGKGLVMRRADGTPERMIGINYDITDLIHAAEEKQKLESRLQQAQKLESIGLLAGGVAHDFNNLLTVILGHAQLGLMHFDTYHPVCTDLKEISKTAERSADLTRQLLAFARKQAIAPRVLDLNETVSGMLKMLQRLIGENIHLDWKPAADLWQTKVDPSQIDQLLANLCVNARDAIKGNGWLTIETENCTIDADYCANNQEATPGEYVRLSVSDDGAGMDKETLKHIFEPFYTTKEFGKGTGLGLATVYGAVKQNNGFINIYSEPGHGTTFSIYIPCDAGSKSSQVIPEVTAQPVARGLETILLVEDEPAILNMASMMLEKNGYTVLKADTPGESIRLARDYAGEIHLLMTDVIMPEMNGRDLARNIISSYPQIKQLFMSGYTADVISQHGVLDDGVHFIQKPFSLPAMVIKVREILDGE